MTAATTVMAMPLLSFPYPDTRCGGVGVEIEGRSRLLSPRLQRVMFEIAALTPHGGPAFLILQQPGRNHMQIAGGDERYCCECRQHEGGAFRHRIAARADRQALGRSDIAMNGSSLGVCDNEVLSCGDVQYLAYALIKGACRSRFFAWRDMMPAFSQDVDA